MDRPVCQKTQYITQLSSFLPALEVQQQLHHDSIVPVISARTEDSENGTVVIGELPWAGESLEREVLRRAKDKQQWSEDEFMLLLDNIVGALAYAQLHGVPHGAVSPSHIFLSGTSTFRISGFLGHTAEDRPHSLAKLPTFHSPLKKRMYANKLIGVVDPDIQHDPYKSDVYSLGLTFLYLLCPHAQQLFNSIDKLTELTGQLQLSQGLKSLLASMLNPEESLRPDSLQLKKAVQRVVESTVLSRAHSQLSKKDFAGLKRSLEVLMRSSWTVTAGIQPPQLKVLSASRALSPQCPRTCKTCHRDFSLLNSEKWRLSLLGSSQAAASKDFCSEQCWQRPEGEIRSTRDTRTSSALRPAHTVEERLQDRVQRSPLTRKPLVFHAIYGPIAIMQTVVAEYQNIGERFYYDCQVHMCEFEDLSVYFNKIVPTMLGQCPECQTHIQATFKEPGLITQLDNGDRIFFAIIITSGIVRNFGKTANIGYSGHYLKPVSNTLRSEVANGRCHFCGARAAQDWSCFFHGGNPYFICSKRCAKTYLQEDAGEEEYAICAKCQEPVDQCFLKAALSSRAGYLSLVACYSAGCCTVCVFAAAIIDLPCGHSFCKKCIDCLLLKRDGDDFPCVFCGVATPISYLQGIA